MKLQTFTKIPILQLRNCPTLKARIGKKTPYYAATATLAVFVYVICESNVIQLCIENSRPYLRDHPALAVNLACHHREISLMIYFEKGKDQFETESIMYINIHTTWS